MDQFRKHQVEKKQKDNPIALPPQGHSTAEILEDDRNRELFGELLKKKGQTELGERILLGGLKKGDIEKLEKYRKLFSESMIRAEKIEKLLTPAKMTELGRNNPNFLKLINQLGPEGPEKVAQVITSQLLAISITDERRFNTIAKAMEEEESQKNGPYKAVNDKVEQFLKEKKITSEEYLAAIAIEDPTKKAQALEQLSYRTNGALKRFFRRPDDTLKQLKDSEADLQTVSDNLDLASSAISSALFMSVNKNQAMLSAYSAELIGEEAVEEPATNFKALKEGMVTEKELAEYWVTEKKSTNYDRKTPTEQDAIRDSFVERAKKHHKEKSKGKGFWHDIKMAFIETFINNTKGKLK